MAAFVIAVGPVIERICPILIGGLVDGVGLGAGVGEGVGVGVGAGVAQAPRINPIITRIDNRNTINPFIANQLLLYSL